MMRRVNDPLCPLCKEEEETSLHFLGKCCATANIRRLHFRVPFLDPGDLKQAHWRFAKPLKNLINQQLVQQGQRIGPDWRPKRQTV